MLKLTYDGFGLNDAANEYRPRLLTFAGCPPEELQRREEIARLLVAAPDMLAALEMVLRNASAQRGTDTDFAAWKRLTASEIGALLTVVRAAIAAAKGDA